MLCGAFKKSTKMTKLQKFAPYLAAVVSGLLLAMCFPGFEVSSGLVWIWPIPLMVGLWLGGGEKKRKRFGFRLAWVAGLTFWLLNIKWLMAMGELPTVPMAGAVAGWLMLGVYLAVYFGLWGVVAASFGNPWKQSEVRELTAIEKKMADKAAKPKRSISGFGNSMRVIAYAVLHASLWVVLEWLRGWMLTGFGWNGLGVAFHDVPVVMQAADLVGVTGIAFVPMFLASIIAQTGKRLIDEVRAGKFQAHFEIATGIGLVALVFAYGVNRMSYYANADFDAVRVMIVQENIKQSLKWDEGLEAQHYINYLTSIEHGLAEVEELNQAKMRQAIETGEEVEIEYPDLLVLPESSFTQSLVYVESKDEVYMPFQTMDALVDNIYAENHFKTVFGANLIGGMIVDDAILYDPERDAYNAFVVADSRVATEENYPTKHLQVHGKNHLVPFGEFVPEVPLLGSVAELFSGMAYGKNFSRSGSYEPLDVELRGRDYQLIPSICFEDTVGRLVRKFARPEQQILVNITNDGWFGESEAVQQHMANSKFRCVEVRRPMARAANTGISGVVSVIGSMAGKKEGEFHMIGTPEDPFVKGTFYGNVEVPRESIMTLYAMAGDWFVVLCLLLSIGSGFFCVKSR